MVVTSECSGCTQEMSLCCTCDPTTTGNSTAYGLCMEIQKPQFIACLLLLSDILAVLGNLSRTFQLSQLNLLTVEQLVKDAKASLTEIKENLFNQGYMTDLEERIQAMGVNENLDTSTFSANARSYIESPRNLQLARAEPSKLATSSGRALETYN